MRFDTSKVLLLAGLVGLSQFSCEKASEPSQPASGGSAGVTGGSAGSGGTSQSGGAGGTDASGGSAGSGGAAGSGGTAGTSSGGSAGKGGSGGSAGGSGGKGGGAGSGGSGGFPPHTGTWEIMPFGDSITAGGCWRAQLLQELEDGGFTDIDFIGSRSGPGCSGGDYDDDNEGHGSYIATDILKAPGTGDRPDWAPGDDPYVSDSGDLATWFDGVTPDILLMHWGTNDVWNNKPPSEIHDAYEAVLTKARQRNPNVILLVAQLIPLQPDGCGHCSSGVTALNATLADWAADNSSDDSPVLVVDQHTGYDISWSSDGVHPSDEQGFQHVADAWYEALEPILSQ